MRGGGGVGLNLTAKLFSTEKNIMFQFLIFCAKQILIWVFSYSKTSLMEANRNVPPVVVKAAPSLFHVDHFVCLEIMLVRSLLRHFTICSVTLFLVPSIRL